MARNERNIKPFTLYDLFSYQVLICHQNGKLTHPILEVTELKVQWGFLPNVLFVGTASFLCT